MTRREIESGLVAFKDAISAVPYDNWLGRCVVEIDDFAGVVILRSRAKYTGDYIRGRWDGLLRRFSGCEIRYVVDPAMR